MSDSISIPTGEEIVSDIEALLAAFVEAPADSDFLHGYADGLRDLHEHLFGADNERLLSIESVERGYIRPPLKDGLQ